MAELAYASGLGPDSVYGMWVQLPPSAHMKKIKKILQSIRIEEYILFIFSIILVFSYLIFKGFKSDFLDFFGNGGFKNIVAGVKYFSFVFIFIYIYIFYKFYLYVIDWLDPFIENKKTLKETFLSLKKLPINFLDKFKKAILFNLLILRPFFVVSVFFGTVVVLLGLLSVILRGSFVDSLLMDLDNKLFGFYPFMGSYYEVSLLLKIIPFLIFGYLFLGSMMGMTWVVLYFNKKKKLFNEYIIAMTLAIMIALPVWIIYPSNSPRHLNNIYNPQRIVHSYENVDEDIRSIIKDNNIDNKILDFHESIGMEKNNIYPISTIPSMHVVWALLILYYLFLFNRRTIFFTLPWNFFSTLGAVYLGQHYFVDIIISFPVAFLSILLANVLVRMEKKYYHNDKFDKYENKIKNQIRNDLAKLINILKFFFSVFRFKK